MLEPVDGATTGTVDTQAVWVGCYATYAQALAAGSGGAIDVPPAVGPSGLSNAMLAASTDADAGATVLIGTEWVGTGFAGASNSYFAASTCTTSTTWQVGYVTDAWNDAFNSGKGFGGCDTNRKFQNAKLRGRGRDLHPELHGLRGARRRGFVPALAHVRGRWLA